MLNRQFFSALKQFHSLAVEGFTVEDFSRVDLAFDLCLNRGIGVVGIEATEDALVEAVFSDAKPFNEGFFGKFLHQGRLVVFDLPINGIEEPLVVVLVANDMARGKHLEVAFFGFGQGLY